MPTQAPPARTEWTMPPHLERFREHITNTGGNSIEILMNDHRSNLRNNGIRACLCVAVQSQMSLLENLHEQRLLKEPA